MKTLIINDPHIGVKRQGGTTPQSRKDLEEWMLDQFIQLLDIPHDELIILGDLCDARNIPEHLMLRLIELLKRENAVIVLGNHDFGGIGDTTLSSCEFIGELSGATVVKNSTLLRKSIFIVPHKFNQEDHERSVSLCPDNVLMLTHCNIDSNFATGDHSLNLSKAEILGLKKKGVRVLAAHEHEQRNYLGVVDVIGNQFPSSISDCLGGPKRAAIIEDGEVTFVPTWEPENDYIELDHTDIKLTDHKFVRVNGGCSIAEYPAIVRQIAELRRKSSAFVIANNVKVKMTERDDVTAEEVTGFNILSLLLENIDEEFRKEVEECV